MAKNKSKTRSDTKKPQTLIQNDETTGKEENAEQSNSAKALPDIVVDHDSAKDNSETSPKFLNNISDHADIRADFDDLNKEVNFAFRNTWEKSQQFIARSFPMLLIAEDSEETCLKLRQDFHAYVKGDISFKKGEPASSTIAKIFALDDRRQASAYKKVLDACLNEYIEKNVSCSTDQEAINWCLEFIKKQGGLESMRRPARPKQLGIKKPKLNKNEQDALMQKGDERAKALPAVALPPLPFFNVPKEKGRIVILVGVTDFGSVIEIKHLINGTEIQTNAILELAKLTEDEFSKALKTQVQSINPVDQALAIDAEDKDILSSEGEAA